MSRLGTYYRSPLFWILLLALVLRLPGLLWGLPASDGWDDDGIAPRNFLVGIAQTYVPGSFFTYPPFHLFLLALLASPGIVMALMKAHALDRADVIAVFIQVPYMTAFALIARLVSMAMSAGTILCIASITERISGRRTAYFAALVCALNAAFTYYGVESNLDGPEIFWSALSLLFWTRLVIECEPSHIRWATLFAAAAVATKDQAYAAFLLSVPAALILWLVVDARPRHHFRKLFLALLTWTAISLLALLLIDGAITNPAGFVKRLAFLTGPASLGYAEYAANGAGYLALLEDIWRHIPRYFPFPTAFLAALGVALHARRWRENPALFVAGLLPLLAALSFTLTFNLVVLRTGNRFLLLQFILLAVYIAMAVDWLVFAIPVRPRLIARGSLAVLAAVALYRCLGIDAAFLFDPRYDTEQWLASHASNATIETYGRNAFLPRFPPNTIVFRNDSSALDRRNPQPHLIEIRAAPQAIEDRRPRFVVINTFVVHDDYGVDAEIVGPNRLVAADTKHATLNTEGRTFFRALYDGKLNYQLAHVSAFDRWPWKAPDGYESLGRTILVFERKP